MKDAYFSETLFDTNIDESNLEKATMVETANVIKNNW